MASLLVIFIVIFLVSTDQLYAQDSQLADAINSYSIKYYRGQIDANQNTIASGYGYATIKTMLLAGARGDSDTDLRNKLGYDTAGISDADVQTSFNRILTKQRNSNPAYELDVGNAMFIQSGFTVLDNYTSTLSNSFLAESKTVNFGSSSSTSDIKSWVQRVTKRSDTNLFRGFGSNQEKVVLMNVLYFSGTKKPQFDRSRLGRQTFTQYNGVTQKTVSGLMVGTTNQFNYSYFQDLDADVLELPYNGNEVSMYVVLPRTVTGLQNLEQNLKLKDLKKAESLLKTSKVDVTMPFISDFNRMGTLAYLALKQEDDVVDDLSGIDGQPDLYEAEDGNSDVFNYGLGTGNSLRGPADVTFKANHPFLYYFRHKPTDIILFMGRLIRPLENGIV